MDGVERILGELKEFKRASLERFDVIEKKVDSVYKFKWKLAGGVGALMVLVETFHIWKN